MDIRYLTQDRWKADALLVPVASSEDGDILQANPALGNFAPWLTESVALRDFKGKKNDLIVLYGAPSLAVPRIILLGLGASQDINLDVYRKTFSKGVQYCRKLGLRSMLLPLFALDNLPYGQERLLEESVDATFLALYTGNLLKTPDKETPADPECLVLGLASETVPERIKQIAKKGEIAARATILARNLANTPGNLLPPAAMAERAAELSALLGFSCTILDEQALADKGLFALLSVGQGSSRPPRLVVLEYAAQGHEEDPPIILVGKGITFDSGGTSLKPAAGMQLMKADMSGAAAVLAAVAAATEEALPKRVIGLLACAENLPGGTASRPGDVVRNMRGDSIEIINTDAEGRLVLCDALSYAQKNWQPEILVDIATLTGACAIALGNEVAGLFCDDTNLTEHICTSGHLAGEYFWPLPLWKPYKKKLKSTVADLSNTGPREGGSITAALFLQHFIEPNVRWAHLDIAGVDWTSRKTPLCPEGATGFGARTLLELLRGSVK